MRNYQDTYEVLFETRLPLAPRLPLWGKVKTCSLHVGPHLYIYTETLGGLDIHIIYHPINYV